MKEGGAPLQPFHSAFNCLASGHRSNVRRDGSAQAPPSADADAVAHRMQQRGHLALAGTDHLRVCVACRRHAERSGEIEIPAPFHVPTFTPRGADDGPRAVLLQRR